MRRDDGPHLAVRPAPRFTTAGVLGDAVELSKKQAREEANTKALDGLRNAHAAAGRVPGWRPVVSR